MAPRQDAARSQESIYPVRHTLEEARRIAVRAQLLDGTATTVLDTVRHLGYLQLDPTNQSWVAFDRAPPGKAVEPDWR